MPADRKPKSLLLILVLCVSAAGLIFGYLLLPNLIEKKARQSLLESTPFSSIDVAVRHVGLFGTEFGNIVVGDAQKNGLAVGSISVIYSPASLIQKRIKHIDINGLTIFLESKNGRISMPGIDIPDLPAKQKAAPATIEMGLDLEQLKISNGILNLDVDGYLVLIPFDLLLTQTDPDHKEIYSATLQAYPRGEKITVSADLNLSENRCLVKIVAESLQLDKFADLFNKVSVRAITGRATIDGQAEINLLPMELVSARIKADLQPFAVDFGSIRIGSPKNDAGSQPLQFTLTVNGRKLLYALQNVSISGPARVTIDSSGTMEMPDGKVHGKGAFSVSISDIPSAANQDVVHITGKANYTYNPPTGEWHIEVTPDKESPARSLDKKIKLQYRGNIIQSAYPDFKVSGQGMNNTGAVSFTASLPRVTFRQDSVAVTLDLFLNGDVKMLPGEAGEEGQFKASGFLELKNGKMQDKKSAVSVQNINGKIPWQWPPSSTSTKGSIAVSKMYWQKNDLGNFKGDITLKETNYFLDSSYTSNLFEGLALNISGQAGLSDTGFAADLQIQTQAGSFASVNLGKINPSLKDSYLNGKLAIDGSMSLDNNGLQGQMLLNMQDGTLEFTEKEYVIDGIGLTVQLPFLPELRTGPTQQLRFNKASFGNISIHQGRVAWQLEPSGSVFIEESAFKWAGGTIYANGVRISPGDEQLTIPLFCDRLKLTEILQQFGIANAEGEGTVSGRIPLHMNKNTITFEDGFLYSSPGQGGSVKVAAFDLLTTGIPKNSPQFAQIDFAAEALKNFKYNWVKLLLQTTGEDLVMQMQMDGKPVQSLPFSYNSETGTFARLKDNQRGVDQPIRLDVNFRFPLNRFLGYSGKIQDLMKKIK